MPPMRGRTRSPKSGFTLLEILLTIILLATGLVSLSAAVSLGMYVGGNNENLLVATNLAEEKTESLKNTAYASIANEVKAAVSGFSAFQREVTVSTPVTNLKQITVTVYWNNKTSELSTSLVTYRSNI